MYLVVVLLMCSIERLDLKLGVFGMTAVREEEVVYSKAIGEHL